VQPAWSRRRRGVTLVDVTPPDEPDAVSVLDTVVPVLESCSALAERLARLLLG
jgi:hypothetical protein